MIIRPDGTQHVLITQPDHAALSARIMAHWRADDFDRSPRRDAILLAIREHDNGWREIDAAPMRSDRGQVLDFMAVPAEVRRGVWPRGAERLAREPYAAALVAQHAVHVYRRYRADDSWSPFFAEMEAIRDRHRAASGVPQDTLLRDYFFLRIGDLLSLTFCNRWTDEQRDDTGSSYVARLEGDRLLVSPDPFAGATVALEITGRELVGDDFAGARSVVIRGTASGAGRGR